MNIVEPYAKIISIHGVSCTPIEVMRIGYDPVGVAALRAIEWAGRISHRSEEKQTNDSWERFIQAVVLQHGDWSIVEHVSATVDMLVDRGITHEIVRHRLFSFTQESTRFVNYEKKMPPSFIKPFDNYCNSGEETIRSRNVKWSLAIERCEQSYKDLLALGTPPQIARSVFPNALASRIIITSNLRNWRHFLIMRTTREAHPQMRQVTVPLLEEFKNRIPLLFDDLHPSRAQSEAIKLPR